MFRKSILLICICMCAVRTASEPCKHDGVEYTPGDEISVPCDEMPGVRHKVHCTERGSWLQATECPKPKPNHIGDIVPPISDSYETPKPKPDESGDEVPPIRKEKPKPPTKKPDPPTKKPEPPKKEPEPSKKEPEPSKKKPTPNPKQYCKYMPVYMPSNFIRYVFRHGEQLDFHCPGRPNVHFKAWCDTDGEWKMGINNCMQLNPQLGQGTTHAHSATGQHAAQPSPGYYFGPPPPGYQPAPVGHQASQPHPHGNQQSHPHPHPHPHPHGNLQSQGATHAHSATGQHAAHANPAGAAFIG